jgi:iron complex transport system permease protein
MSAVAAASAGAPAGGGPAGGAPSAAALAAVPGTHLGRLWLLGGVLALVVAMGLGLTLGAVGIDPKAMVVEILDHVPFVDLDSGLSASQAAIVWDIRFPRVVLAMLVGALLSVAGGSYQGVFRNPLADPYLLGAAAGAGLGATIAIVQRAPGGVVPLAAFAGALVAVALAYAVGAAGDRLRSTASLLLAGVAVASFLTALQTFVLQRNTDVIREVYSWILGRLTTVGWSEVGMLVPYFVVTTVVLLACRRWLDVLAVGDEEATTLGMQPGRSRLLVVGAASLATAAAVSVSGLIGFVGIIVPHTVRLLAGHSYRAVLPLSILFGGTFLILADLIARTVLAPEELPIGVVTAFFGAPFFVLILRTSRRSVT